jgi:hypothetical protein
LEDLSVFRGELLFVLSSLYATAKGIVVADLVDAGPANFNRHAAFEAFRVRHPELAEDVRTLTALEPFYAAVTRRRPAPPPVAPEEAESVARDAIKAVRRICAHLQGDHHAAEAPK